MKPPQVRAPENYSIRIVVTCQQDLHLRQHVCYKHRALEIFSRQILTLIISPWGRPGILKNLWYFSKGADHRNPNPATPVSFSGTTSELQDTQQLSRPFFNNFQAYLIVFVINCQPCPLGMIFWLQKDGNWKFKPYDHFKTVNGRFKLFSLGFLGWVVVQGSRYSRSLNKKGQCCERKSKG